MICSFERGPLNAQSSVALYNDCTRRLRLHPSCGAAARSARRKGSVTCYRATAGLRQSSPTESSQGDRWEAQVQKLSPRSPRFCYARPDLGEIAWQQQQRHSRDGSHRSARSDRLERRFREPRRVQSKSPRDKRYTSYVYYVLLYDINATNMSNTLPTFFPPC